MEDFLSAACRNISDFANPFAVAMAIQKNNSREGAIEDDSTRQAQWSIRSDASASTQVTKNHKADDSVSTARVSNMRSILRLDTQDDTSVSTMQDSIALSLISPKNIQKNPLSLFVVSLKAI